MTDLLLNADAARESPWDFHVMVALDELNLPYRLEPIRRPIEPELKNQLKTHALLGLVPTLVHGDFWLTESVAISEFLAETFAPPTYPRIMPADPHERARARQVMSWLRTSSMGLRSDRPTTSVFGKPVSTPLSDKGRTDADEVLRIAGQLLTPGKQTIASEWCIADADFALMLMRLVANGDAVPTPIRDYAQAQWARPSIRKYLGNIPAAS
jgi:glutathione S-transferase